MANKPIYFDHNATTPLFNEVAAAMNEYMGVPLNPSSIHSYGRIGKKLIEDARTKVAKAIKADSQYQIAFTASGTEANNIALKGFPNHVIITSTIEHPSILNVVGQGLVPVDGNGIITLEAVEKILAHIKGSALISVMHANNEIGVIQPIKELVKLAKKYNAIVHSDMTQTFGKIDLNISDLDVDLATISGHKVGGPQGVGALIYKKNLDIKPLMLGGGQEMKIRPGTHNTIAIHGFGVAASMADYRKYSDVSKLRDYLEEQITLICPESTIFGVKSSRLPNTASFTMPNINSETQLIHFDSREFAISAGAACSSGRIDLPRVHMSLGYDEQIARTAIRVSLGLNNTRDEVDSFVQAWGDLYKQSKLAA
jgi:cysteine desulfurase